MVRSIWICLLAVVCLTVNVSRAYAQQCVVPPSGLVAWYPGDNSFGDMSSTRVARPNGRVGFATGKVGSAFQLDGSTGAWIDVAQPPLNVGTVEFWVNPASLPQDTRFFSQTSGDTWQGGATGFNIFGDGQLAVWTGGAWVSLGATLQTSIWTHLAFAYDGSQVTLYVNGTRAGSASTGFDFTQSSLGIGAKFVQFYGHTFDGEIDEFSIFNRPLSASEVQAIYTAGVAGKCPPVLNWRTVTPSVAPAPRAGHKLVYDPVHHRTLLFGGQSPAGTLFNDVWEFDAARATWTEVTPPAGPAPSPRARFGMAVDPNRNVAVVYGGFVADEPGTNDETWEWDFVTRSWSFRGPGIFDYAGRIGAEMAYDPNLRQVILFGGLPYWNCASNAKTFAWDGSWWSTVSTSGPVARVAHAMATDPVRSKVVMYGGAENECDSNRELFDTWEWDGSGWTKLADAPNSPDTNRGTAAAYDANVNHIVLFGGYVTANAWQWDGAAWKLQAQTNAPSARLTSMAFDPSAGQLIMFGGGIGAYVSVWPTGIAYGAGDTWTANGQGPTALEMLAAVAPYGGVATLSATLHVNGWPLRDQLIEFRLDNVVVGTAKTDAAGLASINVQLDARASGTYPRAIHATFAGTPRYAPTSGSTDLVISKAVPAVIWPTPQPIAFGTPLDARQLNASVTVVGTFAYSPPAGTILEVGVHSLTVTFTPDDGLNYETVQTSVSLIVLKSIPRIDWRQPAPITYGRPLGSDQLNATAPVPGTFIYTPPAGTILSAGFGQRLSVVFTATDSVNYDPASASVAIDVYPAAPVLRWDTPNPIVYGTALSATQLNATSSIPGRFTYTPGAGTVLNAGTQTLLATFAPDDQQNYTNREISVSFVVNKADQPALSVVAPANLVYGTTATLSTTGGAGTGLVGISTGTSTGCAGAFSFVNVTNASGTCTVTASKGSDSNYNAVTSPPVVITLQKASQTIAFGSLPNVRVADSPMTVSATASSGLAVTFTTSTPLVCTSEGLNGSTIRWPVSGTCTVNAHQPGDNNYLAAPDVSQSFQIGSGKLDQTISFATLPTRTILEKSFTVSATASSGLAVTFTSDTTGVCTTGGTNGATITLKSTGDCSIIASQAGNVNYNPAPSVTQTFRLTKSPQTITVSNAPVSLKFNTSVTLTGTASSGLTVTFTSTTPSICTSGKKNGATITAGNVEGPCVVVASQSGNTTYAATSLNLTIDVKP